MNPVSADDPLRTKDQAPDSAPVQPTVAHSPDGTASGCPDPEGTRSYHPDVGDDSPTAAADHSLPSIPGYAIEAVLGRGGMGIVYRARHLALKRTVALKMVLAGGHAGPRELARFKIEAEAVARLQHPNIVQIHEVGEAGGHPYFALEYLEGGSLAKRLVGKSLAPAEAASLVEALARAMQLAHSRNVVHRDLKPSNVLLAADGTPKVTDFGLARRLDDDSGQTQAGAVVGTPSYMAPEQAAGEAHAAGPAADIYALGAVLYECLTGRPPHRGETIAETLDLVRTREPEPPCRLRPSLPRDLETICLKCLRKEPERRYASAEALAEDLRRWAAGEPIAARPVGSLERTVLWIRRKPARAGLVLALVLLGVAVVTFAAVIAIREHQAAEELAGYNQDLLRAQGEKEAALRKALQESARLALDRGLNLCEAGDVGRGLIYLIRALDGAVKAKDADLESAIRFNIAAWETQLWSLRNYREGPAGAHVLAASLSPRGSPLAAALANGAVELWDLRDGHEDQTLHSLPHGEAIKSLAFSGNGDLLLTRTDRTVRIWDVANGRLACPALDHSSSVLAAALSRDGKWVLTGATDNIARLWQTDTGAFVALLSHKQRISAVAFSPRGELALTGDALGVVQLWKVPSGDAAGPPLVHKGVIQAAAFSPDGARIVTGTSLATVHVWQVETAKLIFPPLPLSPGDQVTEVAFSPDGQRIVARAISGRAYLWRADTGNPIASPLAHHGRVESVAFSSDSQTLITGGGGGLAQGWDANRGQPTGPVLAHLDRVRECGFSQDGKSIVTLDGAVRRWRAPAGLRVGPPLEHKGLVRAVAFSPDGRLLLTGGGDGFAWLWSTTAPAAAPLRGVKQGLFVNAVAFSPNSQLALVAGIDTEPSLWHMGGAGCVGLKGHTAGVYAVTFSPDGKTALSGSKDGTARLWDTATAKSLAILPHKGPVEAVAFSPNDRHALTGSADGTAALWDLSTRPPAVQSLPHEGVVETVAFSPDGQTAITADVKDGSIRLWDTATGTLLRTLKGHALGIKALAVSKDGEYLVSGSHDRTARLWKLSTGESVGLPMPHQAVIRRVVFSADGRNVYTASEDNTARRWHVPTGVPIGPAFVHGNVVQDVAVRPDSTVAATGSRDHTAVLWSAPGPRPGSPEELANWAQLVTGMTMDESGATRVLTASAWRQRKHSAK
jgi:WD40 repeat protein